MTIATPDRETVRTSTFSAVPPRIFEGEPALFADHYNRLPFQFSHHLSNSPIFELPRLVALAERMERTRPEKISYHTGNARVDQQWNLDPGRAGTVSEAIARIQDSGSWVLLKSVQEEPEYRALIEQVIDEVESLTGRHIRPEITWPDAYIFIASPHSITPFHVDHEIAFLFQIHGSKEVSVFDPADRSIISEEELERYYLGELNVASYTDDKQVRAFKYDQQPGLGVHHPSLAGHWVRNGADYSVTLNINFCTKRIDRIGRIRQANHYLRGWGLRPLPPGQSAGRDRLKALLMETIGLQGRPKSKFHLLRRGVMRVEAARRILTKLRPASAARR